MENIIEQQIEDCLPPFNSVYCFHDEAKGYAFLVNGNQRWQFITYEQVNSQTQIPVVW